jgi:asparagine synthase (glutamine-hydrolysing)
MCGINGIICFQDKAHDLLHLLEVMNAVVSKRGPDDEGYFSDEKVGLSHRRLSIIDLSPNARQPLCNEDQTLWLTFNGEIYNYRDLRAELIAQGHQFRSHTDSEVIIHAYETWGIDCLNRLDGMFAFGLYDQKKEKLLLAKDRFGKKPLYYTYQQGHLLFSSSLLAFKDVPMVDWRLNLEGLVKYLAYEYVPTPHTIIKDVYKLPMAHYLEFPTRNPPSAVPVPTPYWQVEFQPKLSISKEEASSRLVELLDGAVKKRLISDVPLGVFLSGGIDSSSIVARMAQQVKVEQIKTFSIGFREQSYDESAYSRLVARHLGTDHHEIQVKPEDVPDALPEIMAMLDEPLADSSIIPTYLLSKFTRNTVKVALEGSGADEMLAGYDTFVAHKMAKYYRLLPAEINRLLYRLAKVLPVSSSYMSLDFRIKRFLSGFLDSGSTTPEVRDLVWMSAFSPHALRELCDIEDDGLLTSEFVFSEARKGEEKTSPMDDLDRIVHHYISLYHQDDILFKLDRASMMNSLEVRCPFLDKDLSEFVNRLPTSFKMKGLNRKYLMKRAMAEILPPEVIRKKKQGFAMPVADWLNGRLKPLLQDTLSGAKLQQRGLFNPAYVNSLMQDHFQGRQDNRKPLWTLLVGNLWLEKNEPLLP